MAIGLTGTDDESEDQAGHHPDPDQHSTTETAVRAPDSEPVTPTASPAGGGDSQKPDSQQPDSQNPKAGRPPPCQRRIGMGIFSHWHLNMNAI